MGGKFSSPPHLSVSLKAHKKKLKKTKRILVGKAVVKTHHRYSFARRTCVMVCRICGTFFLLSLHRLSEEPTLDEEYRESDWLGDAGDDLDEVKTNSVPLLSRDPDGASISEECPAVLTDGANLAEANGDHVVTSTVIDLQEVKESKKKSNLFSCLGPGGLSFRKKSRKFRPTSSAFII